MVSRDRDERRFRRAPQVVSFHGAPGDRRVTRETLAGDYAASSGLPQITIGSKFGPHERAPPAVTAVEREKCRATRSPIVVGMPVTISENMGARDPAALNRMRGRVYGCAWDTDKDLHPRVAEGLSLLGEPKYVLFEPDANTYRGDSVLRTSDGRPLILIEKKRKGLDGSPGSVSCWPIRRSAADVVDGIQGSSWKRATAHFSDLHGDERKIASSSVKVARIEPMEGANLRFADATGAPITSAAAWVTRWAQITEKRESAFVLRILCDEYCHRRVLLELSPAEFVLYAEEQKQSGFVAWEEVFRRMMV